MWKYFIVFWHIRGNIRLVQNRPICFVSVRHHWKTCYWERKTFQLRLVVIKCINKNLFGYNLVESWGLQSTLFQIANNRFFQIFQVNLFFLILSKTINVPSASQYNLLYFEIQYFFNDLKLNSIYMFLFFIILLVSSKGNYNSEMYLYIISIIFS